jgi:hypothetical protein
MILPKIAALTLAALVAAGCDSAAASTLTPRPSPPRGALKQSVMPRAPSSKSPAARPAASCHPTTTSGHCYLPGQYCRKSDQGKSGMAGDGAKIVCKKYKQGYRWERA